MRSLKKFYPLCIPCPSLACGAASPLLAYLPKAQNAHAGVSGRVTGASGGVIVDVQVEERRDRRCDDEDKRRRAVQHSESEAGAVSDFGEPARIQDGHRDAARVKRAGQVVRNFALEVGSVSETVTIDGSGININKTDATVGTVMAQTYVKNIPLNGRSFQDLILLTPDRIVSSYVASRTFHSEVRTRT